MVPAASTPAEERLLLLVLALIESKIGLTRAEVFQTVRGYSDSFVTGGDNSALERKFERDKDELRELGVPIETVESPGESGNNQLMRYRIPKGEYELPADIRFTRDELALLTLAATVWREGSLSDDARRALLKLKAQGVEVTGDPLVGYAPQLRTRDVAFEPLSAALARGVEVAFPYLLPGKDAPLERTVAPHAVFQFQGRWYLTGHDAYSDDTRTFLLSRIVGEVRQLKSAAERPSGDPAGAAIARLEALWESNTAIVEVTPDTDASLQLIRRWGTASRGLTPLGAELLEVHYSDRTLFAEQLAGFGPEAVVLEPAELRAEVVARLVRAAADAARPADSDGTGSGSPDADGAGQSRGQGGVDARTDVVTGIHAAVRPQRGRPPRATAAHSLRNTKDRVVLLLTLVPYLLEKYEVTVADAAEHFGVDAEEVRTAVRTLFTSGAPGETATYQPDDLFDFDWDAFEDRDVIVITNTVALDDESVPRFSAREASALLAGLQYLQTLPEFPETAALTSLFDKLTRGSAGVPPRLSVAAGATSAALRSVREAIQAGTQLEFDYLDGRGGSERRRVDPLVLRSADDAWYLYAWCHLREAVRTFRLDRMTEIASTDAPARHRPGEVELPDTLFTASDSDAEVVIRIDRASLPLIADYLTPGAQPQQDGPQHVLVRVRVAHFDGLKRLAARLAGVLTVVGPDAARQAVHGWAAAALQRNETSR